MKTIYLKSALSINNASLKGSQLFDTLRKQSSECLLAHFINDRETSYYPEDIQVDHLSIEKVRSFNPDIIFLENGLINNEAWKIPQAFAAELVENGTVLIIADVGTDAASKDRSGYEEISSFLGCQLRFKNSQPAAIADEQNFWRGHKQIICKTSEMGIDGWLQPIYSGIEKILVGNPVRLDHTSNTLVRGNRNSSGVIVNDVYDRLDPDFTPWGNVIKRGYGFIVFIAGYVSGDAWSREEPGKPKVDNIPWLLNIATFLHQESSRERIRKHRFKLFLSHASEDKPLVEEVSRHIKSSGVAFWLDKEEIVASDSLTGGITDGIKDVTHFILFLTNHALQSSWVTTETELAVQHNLPIIIIRTEDINIPPHLSDLLRIEAEGLPVAEIGEQIAATIIRLEKRKKNSLPGK